MGSISAFSGTSFGVEFQVLSLTQHMALSTLSFVFS
jgi:hypothetical protein